MQVIGPCTAVDVHFAAELVQPACALRYKSEYKQNLYLSRLLFTKIYVLNVQGLGIWV